MAQERPAEQPSPAGLAALAGVRLHPVHTLSKRHFGFTVEHGFKEGNINAEGAASYCRIEAGTDEASDEDERAEKKSIQERFGWETLAVLVAGPRCQPRAGRTTGTPSAWLSPRD